MTSNNDQSRMEADLDRARERLSFYEQFDEIIKQNIASSSALLEAASIRFDTDAAKERQKTRALLSEILDDITALQARSEHLARRVADALDDLENTIEAPGESTAPPVPTPFSSAPPPEVAAAITGSGTGAVRVDPTPPASSTRITPDVASSTDTASPIPVVAPPVELPPTGPTSTTLLVHGVPRASSALQLKSHIEKLDFVSSVEPREFAAGLLRLQVEGQRNLTVADLAGWGMANRIAVKNIGGDLLELDLMPA